MGLTDVTIRNLAAAEKPYLVNDEDGLYLEVTPKGKKLWRIRCRINGKETKRSLGAYPRISLKEARRLRDEAKDKIASGKAQEIGSRGVPTDTFAEMAMEWFNQDILPLSKSHSERVLSRLHRFLFPIFGDRCVRNIGARDLLAVAKEIEASGRIETARIVTGIACQVLQYCFRTGRMEINLSGALRGALAPRSKRHFPSIIDPIKIGAFLRAIDDFQGGAVVGNALKFSVLTFARPTEIRHAEWAEIDFKDALWRIPAEKMKMRRTHIVPLSQQALAILEYMRAITYRSPYVFPCERSISRPMSDAAVNAAIRRMGYTNKEMVAHGFRSMASTNLHERYRPKREGMSVRDIVEIQLAHVEKNTVHAAYNYADYLPERRDMMQWWADWLDSLRNNT